MPTAKPAQKGASSALFCFCAAIAATVLAGCITTAPKPVREAPYLPPTPKNLRGSIAGDVYTAPDAEFRVEVPYKEGTFERQYMMIKEQRHDLSTYVSFGPGGTDGRIFRLEVTILAGGSRSIEEAADQIIRSYIAQVEKGYNVPASRYFKHQTEIAGRKGIYALYVQEIPRWDPLNLGPRPTPEWSGPRWHAIHVLDYETHAGMFWVEVPYPSGDSKHLYGLLSSGSYPPMLSFIRSFAVRP